MGCGKRLKLYLTKFDKTTLGQFLNENRLYTVGTLNPDFDKNMLLLKNPQYLPDHYETLTQ